MEICHYDLNQYEKVILPLDQKRKQLDQQIAEFKETQKKELERQVAAFKEQKDREYLAYKFSLQNVCQVQRAGGAEKGVDIERRSPEEESDLRSQPKAANDTTSSGARLDPGFQNAFRDPSSAQLSMRLKLDPGGTVESTAAAKTSPRERENELQGLFTPGYLPLLDGTTNHERRRSSGESTLPTIRVPGAPDPSFGGVPKLSSSATEIAPTLISPPLHQTRSLSSSAPHGHALQRRDSMRSDTSIASLRSSLKNPSQPRSPKKVLFSIDNTVVSPSSSPVAQRRHTTSSDNLRKLGSGQLGPEKFEIVKKKKIKKSDKRKLQRVRDDRTNENADVSSASAPISNPSSSVSIPSNGWANAFRNWPTNSASTKNDNSSPKPSTDDFEQVEKDDDMFAFDEDMETPPPKKPEQQTNMAETDDVEEGEMAQPMTGSSPHAGSLPIEIKWSARNEGKGEKEFGFNTRDYRG